MNYKLSLLALCGVFTFCITLSIVHSHIQLRSINTKTRLSMKKSGSCPPPVILTGDCEIDPKGHCLSHYDCPGAELCCREGCHKVCKGAGNSSKGWEEWALGNHLNPVQNPGTPRPVSRNQRNRNTILQELSEDDAKSSAVPEIVFHFRNSSQAHLPMNPGCNNFDFRDPTGVEEEDAEISVATNGLCVILWDRLYCQGTSTTLSPSLPDHLVKGHRGLILSGELCDSEKCTRKGYFANPRSCNSYFRCVESHDANNAKNGNNAELVRLNFTCPSSTVFDPKIASCIFASCKDVTAS